MFRVKQESEVSDNDATYLDYRKHVSILSQISNERPTDDRHAFQRVGQFFELRHHPYFFAVAPKIIKANFLEESEIFSQNFDRLLLCLWQYSILGIRELARDAHDLQEMTSQCNEIFKQSMTKPGSNVLQLVRISRALHSGNLELAFHLSDEIDQNHCEESSTLRYFDIIKTVLGMIDEIRPTHDGICKSLGQVDSDPQHGFERHCVRERPPLILFYFRKSLDPETAPTNLSRFKVGQLEAALPNFRASQHFDWAIPVYAAYFADEEAQLIELSKTLQSRLKESYSLKGHLSLVNIQKHVEPSALKFEDHGVHPLYGEVADQIDLLEAAELSDEEDVEPSDVDNGDDVSDADVKHFDQKASIQSSKKFKEEKSKKCCSILLEKLVCLIETQQLNGGSIDEQLLSKFRLVTNRLMKKIEKENREETVSEIFDPVRVRFWEKWIIKNSQGTNFGERLWHFLHPKVNLDSNPIALKQKQNFEEMTRNVVTIGVPPEAATNEPATTHGTSTSKSHDFAGHSADLNLKILKAIRLPRDLAHLKYLDPVIIDHLILKFSSNNYLYTGDSPNSNFGCFSKGQMRFVEEIAESLKNPESGTFSEAVLNAKELLILETRYSVGRIFYETNFDQIRKVLRGYTDQNELDKKAALLLVDKIRVAQDFWCTQLFTVMKQIRHATNYVPFDEQLNQMRSDAEKLAEEFNLDPNLLRYACDKLEEESRRPMTLKAVVKYVLNRPVIEGSADVVARIFQRYFEHLYETSPV